VTAIREADGVFQGGGVKGLALAGALLGFAEHELGIDRWVNVAGTSAGAIIAAYLATGHGPAELERALHAFPFERLQDSGPGGRLGGAAWNLATRHGLARGEFLRDWLDRQLGGATFASVRSEEAAANGTGDPYRLRLIAADVTQRQMLVLPADLARYRLPGTGRPIDIDAFPIADAVRMSMSIPFFFEPVLLESESGEPCTIVDGSILSSFPVWLFDADRAVTRPTFGFRLVGGRRGDGIERLVDAFGWPARLGHDLFHTALEAWDARFTARSTIVRTCAVPVDDVDATDFSLGQAERERLIEGGRQAARRFLDDFRAEDYVNTFGRRLVG
jgi:NTE family protein